jgi:hypothetical protein
MSNLAAAVFYRHKIAIEIASFRHGTRRVDLLLSQRISVVFLNQVSAELPRKS